MDPNDFFIPMCLCNLEPLEIDDSLEMTPRDSISHESQEQISAQWIRSSNIFGLQAYSYRNILQSLKRGDFLIRVGEDGARGAETSEASEREDRDADRGRHQTLRRENRALFSERLFARRQSVKEADDYSVDLWL